MNGEMLRALHLSTWRIRCGIAAYCRSLVEELRAAGVRCEVQPLRSAGAPTSPSEDTEFVERTVRVARDFDVVHIQHQHGFFGDLAFYGLVRALQRNRIGVAATFHAEPCPEGPSPQPWAARRLQNDGPFARWRQLGRLFGGAPGQAKAIVHAHAARRIFAAAGLPVQAIHVISVACPERRKSEEGRAAARAALGLPPDVHLMAAFGFLGPHKGQDVAVDALLELPRDHHLAIVGGVHPNCNDDYLQTLVAKSHPFEGRVSITGYVEDDVAERYLAAADVCLAPYRTSLWQSASGAVTWALASGRPSIASDVEVFQSIQSEAECFLLVPPDEPAELARAVERLREEPSLRKCLVENAAKYL